MSPHPVRCANASSILKAEIVLEPRRRIDDENRHLSAPGVLDING